MAGCGWAGRAGGWLSSSQHPTVDLATVHGDRGYGGRRREPREPTVMRAHAPLVWHTAEGGPRCLCPQRVEGTSQLSGLRQRLSPLWYPEEPPQAGWAPLQQGQQKRWAARELPWVGSFQTMKKPPRPEMGPASHFSALQAEVWTFWTESLRLLQFRVWMDAQMTNLNIKRRRG